MGVSIVTPPVSISSSSLISGRSGSCRTMSGECTSSGASPNTVTSLANDTRRGLVSPCEATRKTFGWYLARGRPRRRDGDVELCKLGDGHSLAHKRQQLRKHSLPERRVRKWVLVNAVLVHQATSGLMEKTSIYRNAQNILTKGRLPHIPGHRPWRKELRHVLQSEVFRAPMLVM